MLFARNEFCSRKRFSYVGLIKEYVYASVYVSGPNPRVKHFVRYRHIRKHQNIVLYVQFVDINGPQGQI